MYRKEIIFNRETREYYCFLNGEFVGFRKTYPCAELLLDQIVYDLYSQTTPPNDFAAVEKRMGLT